MSSLMIGVDVGGTFTDIFVLNETAGTARVAKVPTTRPDQSAGFLDGIIFRKFLLLFMEQPQAPMRSWSARAPRPASSARKDCAMC